MVARRRHALIPMGPGDKRRDDSCAYAAVEKSPPTLCESSRVKPAGDGRGSCPHPVPDSVPRGRTLSCPSCSSEEHTSELQSLMRRSYAVFFLLKKKLVGLSDCDPM